jgi:hypothetical protein
MEFRSCNTNFTLIMEQSKQSLETTISTTVLLTMHTYSSRLIQTACLYVICFICEHFDLAHIVITNSIHVLTTRRHNRILTISNTDLQICNPQIAFCLKTQIENISGDMLLCPPNPPKYKKLSKNKGARRRKRPSKV